MRRRYFFRTLFSAAAVAMVSVVHDYTDLYTDPYDAFLARVRQRVVQIVREEGRGISRLWIDPPRVEGGRCERRVNLRLEAGGSLLNRVTYQWDEISDSKVDAA